VVRFAGVTKLDYEPKRSKAPGAEGRTRLRRGWIVACAFLPMFMITCAAIPNAACVLMLCWLAASAICVRLYAGYGGWSDSV